MWQEIIVGLIVLLAVIFIIYRLIGNFASNASQKPGCSCDCSRCPLDKGNCSDKPDIKRVTPSHLK